VRKIGIGFFCVAFCMAVAFLFPLLSGSWPNVDSEGCLKSCHGGGNPYPDGEIHSVAAHTDCDSCHEGSYEAGNVYASSCIECHPTGGNTGKCELVLFHENSLEYDPPDLSCLDCHSECEGTTTTTALTVKGKRYEVVLVGSFEGCSATTMTFRSDNILVIDCMDGFGVYLPILNFFIAFYWAPDAYLGKGIAILLSGMAIDPFIVAGGITYLGNDLSPVIITGYLLSAS